jgi:integrase
LVRAPRRLPKILEPDEVNKLFRALRHHRDRDEWLADQYQRAAHLIDASMAQAVAE